MKSVLYVIVIVVLSITTLTAQQSVADNNLYGSYIGKLPCDDCAFVTTTLTIEKNQKAGLIMNKHYTNNENNNETSDNAITEVGNWSLDNNFITIVIKDKTLKYILGKNTLTLVDNNGMLISSDEASKFVLTK